MKKYKVTVVLMKDDDEGGYTAFVPLFPDCTTQGDTKEEALVAAKESLELLFEDPTEDNIADLEISYSSEVISEDVEIELPVQPKPVTSR